MSLWPALGPDVGAYRAANASTRSSLSGTLPSFQFHWVMSSWSLEPPPVKMLEGERSTTRSEIWTALLPTPGVAFVHPKTPSAGHVYSLSQSSPVHPRNGGDGVGFGNAVPQVLALASPSSWKTPSLWAASAGVAASANAPRKTSPRSIRIGPVR